MNQELLESAGIAYAEGVHRFAGKADKYEKFVRTFPTDENFAAAKALFEAGDYEGMVTPVHALKGLSGNLSMNAYFNNCKDIVDAIRAGQAQEKVPALWPENVRLYNELVQAISHME